MARNTKTGATLVILAWAVFVLVNALGFALLVYAAKSVSPRSDEAAGLMLVGTVVAWVGDFVALVLASIGTFLGRSRAGVLVAGVVAIGLAIASGIVAPLVAFVWAVATSPTGVH